MNSHNVGKNHSNLKSGIVFGTLAGIGICSCALSFGVVAIPAGLGIIGVSAIAGGIIGWNMPTNSPKLDSSSNSRKIYSDSSNSSDGDEKNPWENFFSCSSTRRR